MDIKTRKILELVVEKASILENYNFVKQVGPAELDRLFQMATEYSCKIWATR
jgi:hypothetical protein